MIQHYWKQWDHNQSKPAVDFSRIWPTCASIEFLYCVKKAIWSQDKLSAYPVRAGNTAETTILHALRVSFINSTSLTFDKSLTTEFDVIASDKGLKYKYSEILVKGKFLCLQYETCRLEGWHLFHEQVCNALSKALTWEVDPWCGFSSSRSL